MAAVLRNDRVDHGLGVTYLHKPVPGSVRVMVIDDSLTVRTVFSRMIDREADLAVVAHAGTAEQALMVLRSTKVDVILLDLEMPGMGGLEALPKILETARGTQVLVVSSLTADGAEATLAALQMGAADTMLKPRPGGFNDEYRTSLLGKIRALGGKPAFPRRPLHPPTHPSRPHGPALRNRPKSSRSARRRAASTRSTCSCVGCRPVSTCRS